MSTEAISLIDRLAGLSFRAKLFAVAVVYMIAMFGVSEAGAGEAAVQIWFASALPLSWLAALGLHWLSLRPRPPLSAAVRGLVERARARPLVAALYGLATVAIEVVVVAEALGRPLFPAL